MQENQSQSSAERRISAPLADAAERSSGSTSEDSAPAGHPAIVVRAAGKVLFSVYITAVPGDTLSVDVETRGEEGDG